MKRLLGALVFCLLVSLGMLSAQGDEFPETEPLPDLNTVTITPDNIDQLMAHPDFKAMVGTLDATRLSNEMLLDSDLTSLLTLQQIQSIPAEKEKIEALVLNGGCSNCLPKLTAEQLATIIDSPGFDFQKQKLSDSQIQDLVTHLHSQGELERLGFIKLYPHAYNSIVTQLNKIFGVVIEKNVELSGCHMISNSELDCHGSVLDLAHMSGLDINLHIEDGVAGWLLKGTNFAGDYFDVRFYNAKTITRSPTTGNLIVNGREDVWKTPSGKNSGHATVWVTDENQFKIFKGYVEVSGMIFDQRAHYNTYSKDGIFKDTDHDGVWDHIKTQDGYLECVNEQGGHLDNCGAGYSNKPKYPKEPAIFDPEEPIEEQEIPKPEPIPEQDLPDESLPPAPEEPIVDEEVDENVDIEDEFDDGEDPGVDCTQLDICSEPPQILDPESSTGIVNPDGGETTFGDSEAGTHYSVKGDAVVNGGVNGNGQFVGTIGTLDDGSMPHIQAAGGLRVTAEGEMLVESDVGPGVQVQLVSGSELIADQLDNGMWSWSCSQCVMQAKATDVVVKSDSPEQMSTMVLTQSSHLAHATLAQDATLTRAGTFGVQNDGVNGLPVVFVQELDDPTRIYFENNHKPREVVMEERLLSFGTGFMLSFGDDHTILEGDLSLALSNDVAPTPTGLVIADTEYQPQVPEFRHMYATHDRNNYAQLAMSNEHRVAFTLHNDAPQSSVLSVFHSGHHVIVETDTVRLMRTSVEQINADLLATYDTTWRGHAIIKDTSAVDQNTQSQIGFTPEHEAQVAYEAELFFENTLWGLSG